MLEINKCGLCGEPMPAGEEMFMYHGHSGPCPKPPIEPEQPEGVITVTLDGQECEMLAELSDDLDLSQNGVMALALRYYYGKRNPGEIG